jgi:AcrR family transcriptional regulator
VKRKLRKYDSQRQRERRALILEHARQMLDEGHEALSMRKLAERVGVSRTTLYNLYGSKDMLTLAAVRNSIREIGARVRSVNPEEGIDMLLTTSRIAAEQMHAYPNYTQAMARALLNAQPDDPLVDVLFGPERPGSTRQIEIAQQKGQIDQDLDPKLLAQHLNGQAWGVTLNWLMGRFDNEQLERERRRASLTTLVGVAKGATRRRLKDELATLSDDTYAHADVVPRKASSS